MQQKGSSKKAILSELKKFQEQNKRYEDGRILCSMCTKPHPIAKKAYELFFESNLGDPGLFPAAAQLEHEVITQLGLLLNHKTAAGFIVSGGTEANLLALLVARGTKQKANPEIILPESAHFSFKKICSLLNIKAVYAKLDGTFRVNPQEVKALVNENTVAIVGTAGTSELGAIDPIDHLSEIALQHHIHLHVDAAFGGLVIPFVNNKTPFDFRLEGVQSITVDPHKMGLAAIPAGGILFRNQKMLEALKIETPYLTDTFQYTFVGTRTGASAASAYAVFRALGREGFQRIVRDCIKNAQYLAKRLIEKGFNLVCEPSLNIIAFRAKNTKRLAERLQTRGWFASYIPRYDCIRIVIMPHVKRKHAIAFLSELETQKEVSF